MMGQQAVVVHRGGTRPIDPAGCAACAAKRIGAATTMLQTSYVRMAFDPQAALKLIEAAAKSASMSSGRSKQVLTVDRVSFQ